MPRSTSSEAHPIACLAFAQLESRGEQWALGPAGQAALRRALSALEGPECSEALLALGSVVTFLEARQGRDAALVITELVQETKARQQKQRLAQAGPWDPATRGHADQRLGGARLARRLDSRASRPERSTPWWSLRS